MAVVHRKPSEGLVFHSDRGVQYASESFRERLGAFQMIQRMSRKGDCWDNACVESFFATLKPRKYFIGRIKLGKKHGEVYSNILLYFIIGTEGILFLTSYVRRSLNRKWVMLKVLLDNVSLKSGQPQFSR